MWTFLFLSGLFLCVSEGFFSELLCIHIVDVDMETVDLHGLILCVSEGDFSELLYVHNVGMKAFDLHGLILCVSEDFLSV